MSELVVIAFDDAFKADEVRLTLLRLQRDHLLDLEDSVVAVKKPDGTIKLHPMHHLTSAGAVESGFWGALVGALFLSPLVGTVTGSGAASIAGALSDVGIADAFVEELAATLSPGASALFVLVRQVNPEQVLHDMHGFGGKVLRTSLSKEDAASLQAALDTAKTRTDA